jgi:hypothetical protein
MTDPSPSRRSAAGAGGAAARVTVAAGATAAPRTGHRPVPLPRLLAVLLAAAALTAGRAASAAPYDEGERVQITGLVTDAEGRPVPGVRVVLEATRRSFSVREMHRTDKDPRRVSSLTDGRGEYKLQWPWDDYFNHFVLLTGIDVRHAREDKLEILEREDISERIRAGSPVAAPILVHNRALVDRVHDFVASVQSADERRIYDEMGTPDDVKRVTYAGSARQGEVSWWYFDAGRVFRFHDGRLDQVERFDPVRRF